MPYMVPRYSTHENPSIYGYRRQRSKMEETIAVVEGYDPARGSNRENVRYKKMCVVPSPDLCVLNPTDV